MKSCICGGEAIIEHEGSKYFACCMECDRQTKETFFELIEAETTWDNCEIESCYGGLSNGRTAKQIKLKAEIFSGLKFKGGSQCIA